MKSIKVLICSHKLMELPFHEFFLAIQGGVAVSECSLPYQSDNTGVNISNKNKSYCELTCHYWAWKNLKDVDIVGLNHYRRYFDFEKSFSRLAPDRCFISTDKFDLQKCQMPL